MTYSYINRLAKEINKCCELSCDEAIIRTLDGEGKKAHGNTLLNSLNSMGNYKDKLATVMLTEGAEQLKERLEAIMNFKKKSKTIKVAAIGLTMILCMSGGVVGAYASTPKGQTPWSVMGETGNSYVYSQKGYYAEDYIFELGWNISEDASNAYPDKVSLTLYDKSAITVSFDKSCKSESKDSKVLNSLTHLLDRLKSEQDNFSIPLEKPFVVSVKYVGDRDMLTLAEEYYRNDQLPQFSAIFQQLDKGVQKEYCIKMINDQKNSFLSSAASGMQSDLIDFCAEKTYQEDKLALFAGIVPQFSKEQLESWIVKASRENKNTFFAVLTKIKNS